MIRFSIVALMLLVPSLGEAQAPTNITSSGLNTQVNQVDNSYNITGGTRPGGGPNLFHSFGQFDVGQTAGINDIANFLNDSGIDTINILARVTGPNISQIYGTIQTTGFGAANLFLINPSGIVLGPSALLDVSGSVSLTTSQYIRLLDGQFRSANFDGSAHSILTIDPSAFEFSSAAPAAYGFSTAPDPNGTITVQGSNLSVSSGQSISLIGGEVVFGSGAQLTAPSGTILLATAASPGEFDISTLSSLPNSEGTSFTSFGTVSIAPDSSIDVHGASTVLIQGGQLMLSVNNATLSTSTSSMPDTISLSQGSSIITSNSGTDLGVDVQLAASTVNLNGSFISTQSEGAERGGNITVTAERLTLDQFAGIFSGTGTGSPGPGGDVVIQGPTGQGGAATAVTLSGFSQIGASTAGDGLGGNITITATSLELSGTSSILSSTSGTAPNGNITARVQKASLTGGSSFSSDTSSIVDGLVGGSITVQGLNGGKAASLILAGRESGIRAATFGQNRLGDILVQTKTLKMMDGALIQSGTPLSQASAGTITIEAGVVDITGQSRISSSAFSLDAGSVTITAHHITLDNSTIATDTSSPSGGRGGDVTLDVQIASLTNTATITSSASNTGIAGDINILARGSMTMMGGSSLTASSTGSGNAGNISINSGSTFLMENSSVTTEASHASGGQITINAPDMIRLIDSTVSTSVAGAANDSNGGNISIDPDFVILKGSQILAQAVAGTGGAIGITAGLFLADASSVVDASSTQGVSGTVQINAPINNRSEVIAPMPESLLAVQT
ncbi:MAG: filamentous hemagglutinin N-terminal domain-containing protein, partial [Nitrospira sp.]|nr:filamentous hemagglutinin N-terminal domain-containing protein [Nitrospira sp.]